MYYVMNLLIYIKNIVCIPVMYVGLLDCQME